MIRNAALAARAEKARSGAALLAVVRRRVSGLKSAGREHKACCPFHEEGTPSFHVIPDKGFYHCFGCGAHGNAIDFVIAHDGVDFPEALARVEADAGLSGETYQREAAKPAAQREPLRARADEFVSSRAAAVTVWRAAGSARDTIVETYLKARGIDPRISSVLDVVRFLPRCPVSLWRRKENWLDRRQVCPAMLLPIVRVTGGRDQRAVEQIGVEVVFLEADGSVKKAFAAQPGRDAPPSRKMWGALQGGGVPIPPPGWRDWRDVSWIDRGRRVRLQGRGEWECTEAELVVAEGFESTLSLYARRIAASGAFATLSLDNMQGRAAVVRARDDDGQTRDALPLYSVTPDFGRRVFTVPDVARVAIGVDADMKRLRGRWVVERPSAPARQRDLTSLERTQICAALAKCQWGRAGAGQVEIVRARMGADFNDLEAA